MPGRTQEYANKSREVRLGEDNLSLGEELHLGEGFLCLGEPKEFTNVTYRFA